jgi:hypothetical protein
VDVRDALDSSLDAIEPLEPLNFLEVRSLFRKRREQMSDSQILFCLAFSGGLPREALRCARTIAKLNDQAGGAQPLSKIAGQTLDTEFSELVRGLMQLAKSWETPIRRVALGQLTVLVQRWSQLDCTADKYFEGVQKAAAEHVELERLLARLVLTMQFFDVMKRMFCQQIDATDIAASWRSQAVHRGELMASIRRDIELNPLDADRRLGEIEPLVPHN